MPAEEQLSQCIAYKTIVLDPLSLGIGSGAVAMETRLGSRRAEVCRILRLHCCERRILSDAAIFDISRMSALVPAAAEALAWSSLETAVSRRSLGEVEIKVKCLSGGLHREDECRDLGICSFSPTTNW